MPIRDERGLYERITLEAFQAGLSWATILRKRPAFRTAFDEFDPDTVAGYTAADIDRLMTDAGIVRNRAKVLAAISNAMATIRLRDHGGLVELIWSIQPQTTPEPRRLAEIPTRSAESLALSKALRAHGFSLHRTNHHVRPDGGHRHPRHPPARQPPPRQLRHLASAIAATALSAPRPRS